MDAVGRVWLDGAVVRYEAPGGGSFSVRLAEVRAIGESTNEDGPFDEDWFLCFVTDAPGWVEVPTGAAGFDAMLAGLAETLGAALSMELARSSACASRVMWPESLRGRALFRFERERAGFLGLFRGRVVRSLVGEVVRAVN